MEINDFAPFAALSIGQAKEIIAGIVHDAISDAKQKAQPTQESQAEVMNIDDAVVFLKENGLPITKKSLYGKTFSGTIPFKRIGKRLVFSRKEAFAMDRKSDLSAAFAIGRSVEAGRKCT